VNLRAKSFSAVGLALILAAPMTAFAQRFPERPLRLIVPVAAGAPADVACRLVADETSTSLGQPIIVENRPGGNSVIAVDAVYNAPADGYTIGCFNVVSLTPALHKSLPWDFLKAMEPVSGYYRLGFFLAISGTLPVKNYSEFISYAKSHPGKLNNYELGPSQKIAFAMFASRAGIDVVDIGFKGPDAYQALVAGQVHAGFDGPQSFPGQLESGKVRLLFVASDQRAPLLPDVPTASEVGLKDFQVPAGLSFWVKAGTNKEAVSKINAAMIRAGKVNRIQEFITKSGAVSKFGSPEELRHQTERDFETWTEGARVANYVPQ